MLERAIERELHRSAGHRILDQVLRPRDRLSFGAELQHLPTVAALQLRVVLPLDAGELARPLGTECADDPQCRVPCGVRPFGGVLERQGAHDAVPLGRCDRCVRPVDVDRLREADPRIVLAGVHQCGGDLRWICIDQRCETVGELLQVDTVDDALRSQHRHVGDDALAWQ